MADALSRLPLEAVHISESSTKADNLALPIFHDAMGDGKVASIFLARENTLLYDICPLLIASVPNPAIFTPNILSIAFDTRLLAEIKKGYLHDPFISSLKAAMPGSSMIANWDGFWFIGKPWPSHIFERCYSISHMTHLAILVQTNHMRL